MFLPDQINEPMSSSSSASHEPTPRRLASNSFAAPSSRKNFSSPEVGRTYSEVPRGVGRRRKASEGVGRGREQRETPQRRSSAYQRDRRPCDGTEKALRRALDDSARSGEIPGATCLAPLISGKVIVRRSAGGFGESEMGAIKASFS
eukprot:scaffold262_cov230-Pinguiococcus_pyrenoidosus.AAC.6